MAFPFTHYARVVWFQLAKPRLWQWSTVFIEPIPSERAFQSFFPFHGSTQDFLDHFAKDVQPRLLFSSKDNTPEFRSLLTSILPESTIIQQADDVLLNRFAVFGTEPINFGETIDWHRDYRSGYVWSRERYDRIDILSGKGSDMKFPAEVSKFHRLNWLGMASWLTADEKYAHKFAAEVTDWIGANPVNIGINWTVPLEIAIRAVNWICAYSFFYPSRAVPNSFWMLFLRTLYAHGLFLEYNLEYVRTPGNHFASNCLGLIALGSFFGDTKAGRRWLQMGCDFLADEILKQNTPDGVNFEKSVPYHRFVTEIFTLALLFADKANKPFSQSYRDRLEAMYDYMARYTRPDGSAPMIGDADNGRIIRFRADENFNTHTDNLAVGARLFNRADFVAKTPSPDALFLGGLSGTSPNHTSASSPADASVTAKQYGNGGYIIHGSAAHHLILDVGDYGKNGRGGHGHNDCLSFELWLHGSVAITDSGTGVYTADAALRNQLRSTRAHNTVMYDNLEQVEYAGVWQIKQDETRPKILDLTLEEHYFHIVVEHYGYASRREAIHRRTMTLTVLDGHGELVIHDEIIMASSVKGRSFYHVPPGITVLNKATTTLECSNGNQQFTLSGDQPFTVEQAPYSPLYGVTERCTEISLPCENTVTLTW